MIGSQLFNFLQSPPEGGRADAQYLCSFCLVVLGACQHQVNVTFRELIQGREIGHKIGCGIWIGLREMSRLSSRTATDGERLLFAFEESDADAQWQTTNDGVMGGRSDGRFTINEEKNMEFFGTLSLENNGGFASVRSRGSNLGLEKGDSIVARVRGDGREYSLNLYTPTRRMAFSYRAKFRTQKDEWIEVRIPLEKFEATSFGRVVRNRPLDPREVNGLGILLGDKKAGPFQLEIDWIKADRTS